MSRPGASRALRRAAPGLLVALVGALAVAANADFAEPPRHDGAGYATLGWSLATGRGYREIHLPGRARHSHFPPGYPSALAGLWSVAGRSDVAAHLLSVGCTVAALVLAWRWFMTIEHRSVALAAGLALAANWTWGRLGGAIQSEPLYFLLGQMILLAAVWVGRRGGSWRAAQLGTLLGLAGLTRHVGVTLIGAVGIDLIFRRRWRESLITGAVAGGVMAPWVAWLMGTGKSTQLELFPGSGFWELIRLQAVFYVQRIPDQLVGPIVEIGVGRSRVVGLAVNLWAVLATGVIGLGWIWAARVPRRRLAGLVPLVTLPLLLVWPFTEAGRFLVPLVPCLIVGAIEGLAPIVARVGLRWPRTWAAWLVAAASLPYPVYAVAMGRAEARRQIDAPFDAACLQLNWPGARPGRILSRYPAEVYWQTGRVGVVPEGDDPAAIERAIDAHGVAYVVVDPPRFARAPANPLAAFVRDRPDRVRAAWSRGEAGSAVVVYEVQPRPAR